MILDLEISTIHFDLIAFILIFSIGIHTFFCPIDLLAIAQDLYEQTRTRDTKDDT